MFLKKRFLYALTLVMVIVLGSVTATLAHGGDLSLIHACVNKNSGSIRIVGANSTCSSKENPLDWGIIGPAGPQGPKGDQGIQGVQGPQGLAGNLALAGQMCPPSLAVVGFDQNGNIICSDMRIGFTPVAQNADWTPITQNFNGVLMAMAPAGCFVDYYSVTHCFDTPFWVDVYEVTNAQYGSAGYFTNPNQPRDSVSWTDAKAFCEARGARLPDKWEWELAARGPDNLTYPWGNDQIADNVVYWLNSCSGGTCDVGSRAGGVSWVGAQDMSGNVSEWMVNIPNPTGRMWRGGSWRDESWWGLGSFNWNIGADSSLTTDYTGFRCARSYFP